MNRVASSQGSSSDSQPWSELRNPFGILEHSSRRPLLRNFLSKPGKSRLHLDYCAAEIRSSPAPEDRRRIGCDGDVDRGGRHGRTGALGGDGGEAVGARPHVPPQDTRVGTVRGHPYAVRAGEELDVHDRVGEVPLRGAHVNACRRPVNGRAVPRVCDFYRWLRRRQTPDRWTRIAPRRCGWCAPVRSSNRRGTDRCEPTACLSLL